MSPIKIFICCNWQKTVASCMSPINIHVLQLAKKVASCMSPIEGHHAAVTQLSCLDQSV